MVNASCVGRGGVARGNILTLGLDDSINNNQSPSPTMRPLEVSGKISLNHPAPSIITRVHRVTSCQKTTYSTKRRGPPPVWPSSAAFAPPRAPAPSADARTWHATTPATRRQPRPPPWAPSRVCARVQTCPCGARIRSIGPSCTVKTQRKWQLGRPLA